MTAGPPGRPRVRVRWPAGRAGRRLGSPSSVEMPVIARVQPLTRTRAVRGPFDYALLARAGRGRGRIGACGCRSAAGARSAWSSRMAGESELADDRLAQPDAVLAASIPADLVALAEWMALEYCSSTRPALWLVLAPGTADGMRARRSLERRADPGGKGGRCGRRRRSSADRQRAMLETLAGARAQRRRGARHPGAAPAGGLAVWSRSSSATQRGDPRAPGGQGRAVATAADRGADEVLAILAASGPAGGWPNQVRRRSTRLPLLLHGVTGSGKTEVYLQAVAAVLAGRALGDRARPRDRADPAGRGAFRPASATSSRSCTRRSGPASATTSGCGSAGRGAGLRRHTLGGVRADARHRADHRRRGARELLQARGRPSLRRARRWPRARPPAAAPCCSPAAPRPGPRAAELTRLRLPRRVDGRPLPPVEVLDMRGRTIRSTRRPGRRWRTSGGPGARRSSCSTGAVGRTSSPAARAARLDVPQLRRRAGPAPPRRLRRLSPLRAPGAGAGRCVECASGSVARHGAGTERIEHELREGLGAPGSRCCGSTPTRRLRAPRGRWRASAAPAGVLVGTQMVAKGHDFPDVALGVVLDADQTLRFPDFRAEERTFSLVTQLAGRTGRGRDGRTGACWCRRWPRRRARSAWQRGTTPKRSWPAS